MEPCHLIRNPVTSQAYLKLPDLLHVSILLGLSTSTEQSRIKSLAADAAFASGDIRFALRICLELVDENYHPAWVLAAALGCWAGGMSSENFGVHVGLADRKKLLGFAIANVEDGGMDELLRVWEGVDLALRCEQVLGEGSGAGLGEGYVGVLLGAPGAEAGSNLQDRSEMEVLKRVARLGGSDAIPPIATAFARVLLPGLAKACHFNKASGLGELSLGELERGLSAGMLIRTALGQSGLAVSDELLAHLAGLAWALGTGRASETGAESSDLAERAHSGTQFENVGLSCLLAIDPNEGASFVEKAVQQAQAFAEVERATRLAIYFYGIQALTLVSDKGPREIESLLHLSTEELLAKMRERPDRALEKRAGAGGTEPGFKKKGLDYGARLAALKDAKGLEGVLPGVDVDRFASGDQEHQQELVLSLVAAPGGPERAGSQPPETRTFEEQSAALRKALALAERYGVDTWRVLIRHVQTLILSDWPDSEVASGVKESREGLSGREVELMHVLTSDVWPALGGARHNRLALLFSLKVSSLLFLFIFFRHYIVVLLGSEEEVPDWEWSCLCVQIEIEAYVSLLSFLRVTVKWAVRNSAKKTCRVATAEAYYIVDQLTLTKRVQQVIIAKVPVPSGRAFIASKSPLQQKPFQKGSQKD